MVTDTTGRRVGRRGATRGKGRGACAVGEEAPVEPTTVSIQDVAGTVDEKRMGQMKKMGDKDKMNKHKEKRGKERSEAG